MKSAFGSVFAKSPVPQTGRSSSFFQLGAGRSRQDRVAQLGTMSAVGTLFGIVDLTSTATAALRWRLLRKSSTGDDVDRTEIMVHAARTVWEKPNPFFSRKRLIATVQQHVDLCGVGFLVAARDGRFNLPIEVWPVRPDRLYPVPDHENFIAGYVYTSPDGERVPLDTEDVMPIVMPDPLDFYGGLSPVQSLMTDIQAVSAAAAWNRSFFLNDAQPGGILEFPEMLQDHEYNLFRQRWKEQHQGVNNAHRVAILEAGAKWVDRKYTMRDMQFTELRKVSSEVIQEAYRIHGHMLGKSETVNRANADAASVDFARYLTIPRADRWKDMLNDNFLPLFGKDLHKTIEWDYDSPVPEDEDVKAGILVKRAQAAKTLVDAGFEAVAVLETCELPEMDYSKPEPKPSPFGPGKDDAAAEDEKKTGATARAFGELIAGLTAHAQTGHPLVIGEPIWALASPYRAASGEADEVDVRPLQEQWLAAREALVGRWATITDAQREELVRRVREVVAAGDYAALADLEVSSTEGAAMLLAEMEALAQSAGAQVGVEAAAQGVFISAAMPPAGALELTATLTAALLARALATSAGQEAARVLSPETTGDQVGDAVADKLRALTDAGPRKALGGALTGAQNAARIETFRQGPVAALYANEKNDKDTCGPCKAINGRWLGNTDNGTDMEQVEKTYPTSGYIDCLGGVNCRGTVTGVWRSKTTGDGA